MRKHESEHHSHNSAWSKLTTITTFDRGKTEPRRWKKGNALVLAKGGQSTLSILVESLIDQLCKLTEKDPVTQKILYNLICKKLFKMKLIDKTYKVEEYQFMRTYYQRALQKLLSVSCSPTIETKLGTFLNQSPTALSLLPSLSSIYGWSRYRTEFEEIEFIARGGFGRVYRVRNKVDGREYAIKKIYLRYPNEYNFIGSLSEVRTLASLDHPNIVAYKAAWFEPISDVVVEAASSSDSSSPKISNGLHTSKSDNPMYDHETIEIEEASSSVVFANISEDAPKRLEGISISHKSSSVHETCSQRKDNEVKPKKTVFTSVSQSNFKNVTEYHDESGNRSNEDSKSSSGAFKERKLLSRNKPNEIAVLHIQMQLYKESLREWLNSRNERLKLKSLGTLPSKAESDTQTELLQSYHLSLDRESLCNALKIFLKILDGVEYIHDKRIIHHDLKPSNIFVEGFEYKDEGGEGADEHEKSENKLNNMDINRWSQVRVGDFGLACQLSHQMSSNVENGGPEDKQLVVIPADVVDRMKSHMKIGGHTQGEVKTKEVLGTKLYAAPEQLKGQCNIQSDMYSLGIILFELLLPFYTVMEKVEALSALRDGTIPTNFEMQYPELAHVVRKLLSHNPSHRPSIKDLIKSMKKYLRGITELPNDFRSEAVGNDTSFCEDMVFVKETKTEHFVSVSHYESKTTSKLHEISYDTWKETPQDIDDSLKCSCGKPNCSFVQTEQEKTISRLMEENLEKDEIILKLKQQISELQLNKSSGFTEFNT